MQEKKPLFDRVSRRSFLRGSGGIIGAAGLVGVMGTACDTDDRFDDGIVEPPAGTRSDPTPPPPSSRTGDMLHFFTPAEARTVDAIASRLLPGDDSDPGAHEAGVVWYIDGALGRGDGFNQPIYHEAPFVAATTEGSDTGSTAGRSEFTTVHVPQGQLDRYGYQSALTPREMYRSGLVSLDAFTKQNFGGRTFVDLSESEQDSVISSLENDKADTFSEPSAKSFFQMLLDDTVYGMFSDPAYGGNRDMVGWKLIGYPGAQRAYPPEDFRTEGVAQRRRPQDLAMLAAFHAGERTHDSEILPVSGSEIHHHDGK